MGDPITQPVHDGSRTRCSKLCTTWSRLSGMGSGYEEELTKAFLTTNNRCVKQKTVRAHCRQKMLSFQYPTFLYPRSCMFMMWWEESPTGGPRMLVAYWSSCQ